MPSLARFVATPTRASRALTVGLAAMLVGGLLAVPSVGGAQEAEIRTAVEGLSGYSGNAEGSPMSVQFFEATGGSIPTDPGEPEFEATESYSRAVLGTGPQSRATASSFWPGPAVGDGFGAICSCPAGYEVKADVRYPEGIQNEEGETVYEDDKSAPETKSGMLAQAFGLDVYAQASSSNSANESGAGFGSSASESTSTVTEDGVVVTTVDSAVEDISIGEGAITIDSVRTVLTATSDGEVATTEGTTTVSGFRFLGQPFVVDEDGVRPGEGDTLSPPRSNVTELEDFGITVELVEHEEDVNGASGSRFAGGLVITMDNSSFAEGVQTFEEESGQDSPVDPLSPPQTGLNEELDNQLANLYVSALFPLLTGSADVRYIYGRGRVSVAGSPPFSLPDFDPPAFDPPPATTTTPPPSNTTVQPPTVTGGVSTPPAPAPEQPTQVAPPADGGQTLAAAPELPDWFDGLPFVLFLLGALAAGIGGYGLSGLSAAALGSGSSEFCESGAPKRVPDLRTG